MEKSKVPHFLAHPVFCIYLVRLLGSSFNTAVDKKHKTKNCKRVKMLQCKIYIFTCRHLRFTFFIKVF